MPGKRYKNLGNGGTENSPLNFKKKDFENAKMMDYNQSNTMMYKPMSHRGPGGEGHESITKGIELGEATANLSDMYKRDAAMKIPSFPEFTTTSAGYTQVGGEGSIEPFPSAVYIGKGTSVPGVGRTFSEKEISAGRKQYEKLMQRKMAGQEYLRKKLKGES